MKQHVLLPLNLICVCATKVRTHTLWRCRWAWGWTAADELLSSGCFSARLSRLFLSFMRLFGGGVAGWRKTAPTPFL